MSEIKNWITQIKKGYLELCILSFIEVHEKSYGFHLISSLADLGIDIKEGTLYPMLSRMTKDGLLAARWETKDIQGHPRKFYSLEKKGHQALIEMKDHFQEMNQIYEKILASRGK